MAKSKNLLTTGLRGSVGGTLVFRKVNGQTIVSASPDKGSKEPSEKQLTQREQFKLASLYAQRVKADPDLLLEYHLAAKSKGYTNVTNFIVADYFRLPEILSFNVSAKPAGTVLETIVVDYMRVKTVTVAIVGPDGSALESGNGNMSTDKQTWTYLIQNSTNLTAGVYFEITATDLPGNVTTKSFEYQA